MSVISENLHAVMNVVPVDDVVGEVTSQIAKSNDAHFFGSKGLWIVFRDLVDCGSCDELGLHQAFQSTASNKDNRKFCANGGCDSARCLLHSTKTASILAAFCGFDQ